MDLAEKVLAGDVRAIARAISLVEDETAAGIALIRHIYARTGRAYVVGITGAPGAGKSTLVDRLITELRGRGLSVGVVAIDPTSPFTGGAILGDRVRMVAHSGDAGVFIRSMATRGHLGGLARASSDVALILDAAGKDIVIIETVGVGQDEVDIVRTADASVVVLVPGTGDDVQAIKAGIMEIADVFVVNKADREGADRTVQSIQANLSLQTFVEDEWRPPIVKTDATSGLGIAPLWDAVTTFREHSAARRATRQRARQQWRLREILTRRLLEQVERSVPAGELQQVIDAMASRGIDPYTAADALVHRTLHTTVVEADAGVTRVPGHESGHRAL